MKLSPEKLELILEDEIPASEITNEELLQLELLLMDAIHAKLSPIQLDSQVIH